MTSRHIFSLISLLFLLNYAHAYWWYLGLSGSSHNPVNESLRCSDLSILTPVQKSEVCGGRKAKSALSVLQNGAAMGIEECQYQFQGRRWNCSTFNTSSVFGKVLERKSRERAYIYAISSAGVMHAVTRACASGEMTSCGCDRRLNKAGEDFVWGGCSHNVAYGARFTRDILDVTEAKKQSDGIINLWNNAAGRKAIQNNMKLLCKCHGVSGSCSVKICWKTVPYFREVGQILKEKFEGASKMLVITRKNRPKLKPINKIFKKPTKHDLVYVEESPDYCNKNPGEGSLGTHGRECSASSPGLDNCLLLCCGRGYQTVVEIIKEDCDCKFVWCCDVRCKKCERTVEKYICN